MFKLGGTANVRLEVLNLVLQRTVSGSRYLAIIPVRNGRGFMAYMCVLGSQLIIFVRRDEPARAVSCQALVVCPELGKNVVKPRSMNLCDGRRHHHRAWGGIRCDVVVTACGEFATESSAMVAFAVISRVPM